MIKPIANFFRSLHMVAGITTLPEDASPRQERLFVMAWLGIVLFMILWIPFLFYMFLRR